MAIQLEKVVLELSTDSKQIKQGLDDVISRLGKARTGSKAAGGGFGDLEQSWLRLTSAFGAGALMEKAVSGIVSMGTSAIKAAGDIVDLSDKTGLSTDAVQLYGAVAKQTGGELETYANAIFKLGINLSKGGQEVESSVSRLGLNFRELRKLKPEEQFEAIAAKLKDITNEGDRNRIGVALFGKQWKDVAPGVVAGLEDIKNATVIAGEEQVRAIDAASDAWDQFMTNSQASLTTFLGNTVIGFNALKGTIQESINSLPVGLSAAASILEGAFAPWLLGPPSLDPKTLAGQLPKSAQDALDAIFGLSLGGKNGGKPGRTGAGDAAAVANAKKQADEAERYAKAIKELADTMTGAHLNQEMHKLSDAIDIVNARGTTLGGEVLEKIVAQLFEMYDAGIELTPVLSAMLDPFLKSRQADEASRILNDIHDIQQQIIDAADSEEGRRAVEWFNSLVNKTPTADLANIGRVKIDLTIPIDRAKEAQQQYIDIVEASTTVLNLFGKIGGKAWQSVAAVSLQAIDIARNYQNAMQEAKTIADDTQRHAAETAASEAAMGSIAMMGFGLWLQYIQHLEAEQKRLAAQLRSLIQQYQEFGALGQAARHAGESQVDYVNRLQNGIDAMTRRSQEAQGPLSRLQDLISGTGWGVLPESFSGLATALAGLPGLTNDQRQAIEQLVGTPSWEVEQQKAEAYGITLEQLGPRFNQSRLNDSFDSLFTDFEMFRQSGADMTAVLGGMSDEVQAVVDQARHFGTLIPEYMRPMLQALVDSGQLLDENGNALHDLSSFQFSDSIESSFMRMADLLEQIVGLLGGAGMGFRDLAKNIGTVRAPGLAPSLEDGDQRILGAPDRFSAAADALTKAQPPSRRPGVFGAPVPEAPSTGDQRVQQVTQYTGNVELNIAGKRVGEVLIEDILKTFENNAGDGRPVGPTTRLSIALGRAA